jgi:hypothetical protein
MGYSLVEGQTYKGMNFPLFFKCDNSPEDEIPFTRTVASVLIGNKCPICSKVRPGKYYNLKLLYPELCGTWDYAKNIGIKPEELSPFSNKKFWWKCEKSHEWQASPNSRIINNTGCPHCYKSKGENAITKFLIENKIEFQSQFKFDNFKSKNNKFYSFDFGIYYDFGNGIELILCEYDGELHYRPYHKAKESQQKLEDCQRRDLIKTKYCEDNNIKLIRIPYWEFKNIDTILSKELKL